MQRQQDLLECENLRCSVKIRYHKHLESIKKNLNTKYLTLNTKYYLNTFSKKVFKYLFDYLKKYFNSI